MPRRGLGRTWPAIQRFDPHASHHRRHPIPADRHSLAAQQVTQHPAARERIVQMQGVNPSHDRKVRRRHRPGRVVEIAATELQQVSLPEQRQIVAAIDHRFALSRPALPSAPDKKSFSSVSSPILACSTFKSTAGVVSVPV
jgi:hypothetical protein